MTWPIVFIILPAALPKFKICTSLASSGFAKLSFAASQQPEHLEPMPNYLDHNSITWLIGTLQSSFFTHCTEHQPRCETLIKSCSCFDKSCMLHSRSTSCSAHINVQWPCWQNAFQIGHLPQILPIGGLFADIVRNLWEPFWTILTLLLMNSSEPFGTVLNYAKEWISSK